MKKVRAIQNLINCMTDDNFLNLYYVVDAQTFKRESICFLTMNEAISHLKYLKSIYNRNYLIDETCVYCA